MCLDYRLYNYSEILNCTSFPLASFDTYVGALFRGTRCWADSDAQLSETKKRANSQLPNLRGCCRRGHFQALKVLQIPT